MKKVAFPAVLLFVVGFILTAHDNTPRLPQGTLVNKTHAEEIKAQLDRLNEGEVATVTIGNEHVTFAVLKYFMSTDNVRGVSGGDPCKAYKLTTKDGTEEVGVVCKSTPFGEQWEHRPWREWFRSLG